VSSEKLVKAFKTFVTSDVWLYMKAELERTREEFLSDLADPKNSREEDMYLKGRIFENDSLCELPESILNCLENDKTFEGE
jgi:hypothetical protein